MKCDKYNLRKHFFTTLFFALGISKLTSSLKIKNLHVPEVTEFGSPVVLDCDYTWDDLKDNGLVVKWFFNNGRTPIYQWITTKKPQALGILKGRLNLEYSASQNLHSKHRALHITKPAPELSGDYTCSVSSFNDEDSRTKSMLVFVPGRSLNLRQERSGENLFRVYCSAEGVFPLPEMTLLQSDREMNDSVVTIEEKGGLYNIKAFTDLPRLASAEEFSCELRIPQANYTVRKEAVYYPNSSWCFNRPTSILVAVCFTSAFAVLFGSSA